jgi:hypothetical protein
MKKSATAIDEENSSAGGAENQHPGNGHSNLRPGRANRGYNPKYDSATYLVDGQPESVPLRDRTNICIGAGGSAPKTEQSFMKVSKISTQNCDISFIATDTIIHGILHEFYASITYLI